MSEQYFERLSLIDFYLTYIGSIQRNDLIRHFDIGPVTATRDLKEYRKQFPENITYDVSSKSYVQNKSSFTKNFDHDDEFALHFLSTGEWIRKIETNKLIGIETRYINNTYSDRVISDITQSIFKKTSLKIDYISLKSGNSSKIIFPKHIFELGSKWYVRVFKVTDNKMNGHYFNLKLSRIKSSIPVSSGSGFKKMLMEDLLWESEIIITVAPHPDLPHPEIAIIDLNLEDKPILNIKTNEAIAGIVLSSMKIDITENASENPLNYQLRLMNRHELIKIPALGYLFK